MAETETLTSVLQRAYGLSDKAIGSHRHPVGVPAKPAASGPPCVAWSALPHAYMLEHSKFLPPSGGAGSGVCAKDKDSASLQVSRVRRRRRRPCSHCTHPSATRVTRALGVRFRVRVRVRVRARVRVCQAKHYCSRALSFRSTVNATVCLSRTTRRDCY